MVEIIRWIIFLAIIGWAVYYLIYGLRGETE